MKILLLSTLLLLVSCGKDYTTSTTIYVDDSGYPTLEHKTCVELINLFN